MRELLGQSLTPEADEAALEELAALEADEAAAEAAAQEAELPEVPKACFSVSAVTFVWSGCAYLWHLQSLTDLFCILVN